MLIADKNKSEIYRELVRQYDALPLKTSSYVQYILKNIKKMEKESPECCI